MKSTSSFTVLPDFGLYCSSKNFFMMRVGGQSGTAIVSTTSSAEAMLAPPTISVAAKLAAVANPFSFVITVIVRFPPMVNRIASGRASGHRLAACGTEDVDLGSIDGDGNGIAGFH